MTVLSLGSAIPRPLSNESIRSDETDTSITTDGSSHIIIEMLNEDIPAEQRTELSAPDLKFALMSVDKALHEIINERQRNEDTQIERFAREFLLLVEGETDGADTSTIAVTIPGLPDLKDSPDSFLHRGQLVLEYLGEQLGKLSRNEFEGNLGRWASNLTISGLRSGLVTGTLTVIRQLVGFALEKLLQSNGTSPLARSVIGTVVQMFGPLLNVLGAIRDEYNGTANQDTRLARLLTLALWVMTFAVAATAPAALSALASFGSPMAFYTVAQDLVALFCPTGDNAKASPGGTAAAGLINGILQFLSFTGMNYLAPNSGPGYVMAQGNQSSPPEEQGLASQLSAWVEQQASTLSADLSVEDRVNQMVDSLAPMLGHDLWRAVLNGLADVFGQVFMGEAVHALQAEPSENGFRVAPTSFRIPTAEQAANQLLSTDAIRTSVGQMIMAVVIGTSRHLSKLPISKETVNHIANVCVAAVVFAVRPGTAYVNARTDPKAG
ncbi:MULTISPECIES: hypothetical protein [unclassified Pseudomonas]|uniref:hypothetical protein n=1 Tax=unclassified Pseudomonas TaxID=196821 RepID=UPI00088FC199|nr:MULTISPECIES: hypothetical protein [unclassified Pseudomonas]SCY38821.1 hypothetical protein SAMN03159391_01718 [Pseudomonas sp. NFACC37-1]SFN54290.1 hypothetical protein SAMN03159304_00320 [Pseudomonas sp. NFACC24-1]